MSLCFPRACHAWKALPSHQRPLPPLLCALIVIVVVCGASPGTLSSEGWSGHHRPQSLVSISVVPSEPVNSRAEQCLSSWPSASEHCPSSPLSIRGASPLRPRPCPPRLHLRVTVLSGLCRSPRAELPLNQDPGPPTPPLTSEPRKQNASSSYVHQTAPSLTILSSEDIGAFLGAMSCQFFPVKSLKLCPDQFGSGDRAVA